MVMKTIGIHSIGVAKGSLMLDNSSRLEELGTTAAFLDSKIGTRLLPRIPAGQETSDLAAEAIQNVLLSSSFTLSEIECLIVCTQNPDGGGIPHVSAIIHGKMALSENCACFDLSLGCSGYVYGLSVIQSFMASNGMSCGLLVTADPYSKIIDPTDRNTALLFGDAATATLVVSSVHRPLLQAGPFRFATKGLAGSAIRRGNSYLEMQGRAVFEFAMSEVPKQVNLLLKECNETSDTVDAFIFHQGSRFIVEQLAQKLSLDMSKVPLGIQNTGNTVSSSIPILLAEIIGNTSVQKVLLSGFGVGLSWASCLLTRNNNNLDDN